MKANIIQEIRLSVISGADNEDNMPKFFLKSIFILDIYSYKCNI